MLVREGIRAMGSSIEASGLPTPLKGQEAIMLSVHQFSASSGLSNFVGLPGEGERLMSCVSPLE